MMPRAAASRATRSPRRTLAALRRRGSTTGQAPATPERDWSRSSTSARAGDAAKAWASNRRRGAWARYASSNASSSRWSAPSSWVRNSRGSGRSPASNAAMNCSLRRSISAIASPIVALERRAEPLPEPAHDLVGVVRRHPVHLRARLVRAAGLKDDDLHDAPVIRPQLAEDRLDDELRLDIAGVVGREGLERWSVVMLTV